MLDVLAAFEARLEANRREWRHCHAVRGRAPKLGRTHDGIRFVVGGVEFTLDARSLHNGIRRFELSTIEAVGLFFSSGEVDLVGIVRGKERVLVRRTTTVKGWSAMVWLCDLLAERIALQAASDVSDVPDTLRQLLEGR